MKNFAIKGTSIFAVGLFCVAIIASGLSVIETGERGVVLRLGRYAGTMNEGLNFKIPMVDKVVKLTVRDTKYTAKLEVSSSDMQTIAVEESLVYALNTKDVGLIYQKYGTKYEDILIKPTLAEITNLSEISDKINAKFNEKVKDSGIIVKSLSLTNHDFSDEYNKAIEAKKVAEQGALKAKYDLGG